MATSSPFRPTLTLVLTETAVKGFLPAPFRLLILVDQEADRPGMVWSTARNTVLFQGEVDPDLASVRIRFAIEPNASAFALHGNVHEMEISLEDLGDGETFGTWASQEVRLRSIESLVTAPQALSMRLSVQWHLHTPVEDVLEYVLENTMERAGMYGIRVLARRTWAAKLAPQKPTEVAEPRSATEIADSFTKPEKADPFSATAEPFSATEKAEPLSKTEMAAHFSPADIRWLNLALTNLYFSYLLRPGSPWDLRPAIRANFGSHSFDGRERVLYGTECWNAFQYGFLGAAAGLSENEVLAIPNLGATFRLLEEIGLRDVTDRYLQDDGPAWLETLMDRPHLRAELLRLGRGIERERISPRADLAVPNALGLGYDLGKSLNGRKMPRITTVMTLIREAGFPVEPFSA